MSVPHISAVHVEPSAKAELIYEQARSEVAGRLWQAALGDDASDPMDTGNRGRPDLGFETLIALLASDGKTEAPLPLPSTVNPAIADVDSGASGQIPVSDDDRPDGGGAPAATLGPNAGYAEALGAAASRTGIPAPALAAIIQAEAAKGADGQWLAHSRNTRSSAAGLGQFLSGTWIDEAQQTGTWLHDVAATRGWLDWNGQVLPAARSALLALRYDGAASIQTIADYAKANLEGLRAAGITIADNVESVARIAYISHHLGLGDAIRFLGKGLDPARARVLLRAQIGATAANERIADAGSASRAHREWLLGFIDHHVRAARFVSASNNYRRTAKVS
jgi:hypothetical protein